MAERMVAELAGNSQEKWDECEASARRALAARETLWDGIEGLLQHHLPYGASA
jgi:hypothetical protein